MSLSFIWQSLILNWERVFFSFKLGKTLVWLVKTFTWSQTGTDIQNNPNLGFLQMCTRPSDLTYVTSVFQWKKVSGGGKAPEQTARPFPGPFRILSEMFDRLWAFLKGEQVNEKTESGLHRHVQHCTERCESLQPCCHVSLEAARGLRPVREAPGCGFVLMLKNRILHSKTWK